MNDQNQQNTGSSQDDSHVNPAENSQPSPINNSASGASSGTGGNPPKKNDLSGIMEENVDIGSLVQNAGNHDQINEFIAWAKSNIPAHPATQFNNDEFIKLLAASISLTVNEKKGIILNVPKLSQFQIDELMKIFREEQEKFTALEKKHAEKMAELEKQHKSPEAAAEKQEAEEAQKRALQEAEELKKKLGL